MAAVPRPRQRTPRLRDHVHTPTPPALACWRDTRAWRPMLAIARLPWATLDEMLGDTLHETFDRALASVCDGDMAPLAEIVGDDSVSVWVRIALVDAWALRVTLGDAPMAALEDTLLPIGLRHAERLRAGEFDETGGPEFIDWIASVACDTGSARLAQAAREWFAQELIDPQHMDRALFESEFAKTPEQRRADVAQRGDGYIDDAEREIGWWAWYRDEAPLPGPPPTGQLRSVKVGRNDPCPCGSGKKYKKCHGAPA